MFSHFLKSCSPVAHLVKERYARLFSIKEIEESEVLQWSFGAVLFFFFLTFKSWIVSSLITIETATANTEVCWPYFQGCGKWYFLQALPDGYTQSIFYMGLYALMLLIVHAMWRRAWVRAHVLLLVLLLWKLIVMFLLSYHISGPYDYYHVIFSLVLLLVSSKEYFLKISFIILYFLAGTTKFDDTWILGTYFSTLQTGLPLFPDSLIPFFTNVVIFMQVVGAWLLISTRHLVQRSVLLFFIAFHLYSGIIVYYHYPSITLPLLLILFGPMYRYSLPPFHLSSIAGWLCIALIFLFHLPPLLIEGDRRLTLEGNRYGVFMFEANHQCIATIRTYRTVNTSPIPQSMVGTNCTAQTCLTATKFYEDNGLFVEEQRYETGAAWNRCDPYVEWSRLHGRCARNPSIERIAFTFDHSINGGPFYRIVDTPNICDLAYKPFSHNAWIVSPPDATIIGIPVKDEYQY